MTYTKQYVTQNEQGVFQVGQFGISLDSVVILFQQGHSAETIQQQLPDLSLEEVYGAIVFYLANQSEVQNYLTLRGLRWKDVRQRIE